MNLMNVVCDMNNNLCKNDFSAIFGDDDLWELYMDCDNIIEFYGNLSTLNKKKFSMFISQRVFIEGVDVDLGGNGNAHIQLVSGGLRVTSDTNINSPLIIVPIASNTVVLREGKLNV